MRRDKAIAQAGEGVRRKRSHLEDVVHLLHLLLLQFGVGELVPLVGDATEAEDVLYGGEPGGGARGAERRQDNVDVGPGRQGGSTGGRRHGLRNRWGGEPGR